MKKFLKKFFFLKREAFEIGKIIALGTFIFAGYNLYVGNKISESNLELNKLRIIQNGFDFILNEKNHGRGEILKTLMELDVRPTGLNLKKIFINSLNCTNLCTFSESNLSDSEIKNSTFLKSVFYNTNFSNAVFYNNNIDYVDFRSANLCGSEFIDNDLSNVKFKSKSSYIKECGISKVPCITNRGSKNNKYDLPVCSNSPSAADIPKNST
ncbi:pentapeptide repeat-containing protein [Francisella sp. 19X1-34]|uniref:pentapeptide repeat-containing protein n=1 Tax=Francisella sp. 19X1-34 TaxID=3087177 RepID=UPI002E335FAE|nr:pentapeptide repeat-containing protein [Francisella sp. 19X1-34]MED7788539.1 pentapeptide repeat-containing protein [Francisella sp. 19X1-34]